MEKQEAIAIAMQFASYCQRGFINLVKKSYELDKEIVYMKSVDNGGNGNKNDKNDDKNDRNDRGKEGKKRNYGTGVVHHVFYGWAAYSMLKRSEDSVDVNADNCDFNENCCENEDENDDGDGDKDKETGEVINYSKVVYFLLNKTDPERLEELMKCQGNGESLLMFAATAGKPKLMEYLLKRDRKMTMICNNSGASALICCINGYSKSPIECVKVLFKYMEVEEITELVNKSPVNTKLTPLHHAAKADKYEIVELLLKHGANVTARNSELKSPVDVAPRNSNSHQILQTAWKAIEIEYFKRVDQLITDNVDDDVDDGKKKRDKQKNQSNGNNNNNSNKKKKKNNKKDKKSQSASTFKSLIEISSSNNNNNTNNSPSLKKIDEKIDGEDEKETEISDIATTKIENNSIDVKGDDDNDDNDDNDDDNDDSEAIKDFKRALYSKYPTAEYLDIKPEYLLFDRIQELNDLSDAQITLLQEIHNRSLNANRYLMFDIKRFSVRE